MADVATRYNPLSQSANTFPRTIGVPADAAKWEAWFGPMPDKPQPSPFSNYPIEHKTLPDAYSGRNVFLAEKISGLVNTTGDFWTNRLLPWQQSQHIGPFTWSEWHFNQVLASRVPHEGVPRLVTISQKSFMARPVRRGLAAEFEGDFVNHPEGQIAMARKIQGMVVSIQTTINYDAQHTILIANEQRKSDWQKTSVTRVPIGTEIELEIESFNAVGKSPAGFVALHKKVKHLLVNRGANPGNMVLLVTPETPTDMALNAQPQPEPYRLIGGDVQRRSTGELGRTGVPEGGSLVLPDGTEMIEIRDLLVEENAPPQQLFTRNVLIGEYYLINWAENSKANLFDGCGGSSERYVYCSDHRSILIHDAELDKMAKITLRECIEFGGQNTGFPDMGIVNALINKGYTYSDFYPDADSTGERDERRNQGSNMKRSPHMMLFWQESNGARVVHHFGNMDDNVTSNHVFRQIGQTMAAKGVGEDDNDDSRDLVSLMQELEDAPYSDAFFRALITENLPYSAKDGSFVGEYLVDRELIAKYGYDTHRPEWITQPHGGLKLPSKAEDTGELPEVPPGMANLAGLFSLAEDSTWGDLHERAKTAVKLVRKKYNEWTNVESEAFRADNRAPWFHKPDGLFTFFDNCVYTPRDPLFMAAPGISGSGGTGGVSKDETVISGPASKQLVFDVYNGDDFPQGAFNQFVTDVTSEADDSGIKDDNLTHDMVIPHIYTALFKMGTASGPAMVRVMSNLDEDYQKRLANVVLGTKVKGARKMILGLSGLSDDDIVNAVKVLTDASVSKEERRKLASQLTKSEAAQLSDEDVPGLARPTIMLRIQNRPAISGGNPLTTRASSRTGVNPTFDDDSVNNAPYYRTPLAMTPGLARSLGSAVINIPLVMPSDPDSGHTTHLTASTLSRDMTDMFSRPQYASFTGAVLKNRKSEHTTWGGHHMEYLAAKAKGSVYGSSSSSALAGGSSSRGDLFGAATSFGDDELFGETSVIESIASALSGRGGSMAVGARQPYKYKDPRGEFGSRSVHFDRRRPFSYLGGALLGDYNHGVEPVDESDGHRLIYEFDTDNMRMHIAEASRISDNPMVRWGALAVLMARCDGPQFWMDMIDANILVPCNAVLMRFRQEFLTDSFVLMEPGTNTGGTLFNNASSIVGWDAIVRRMHINFVFYSKAMVWNPDNIYVMENAQIRRYIRGRGIRFITNIDEIATDTRVGTYDIVSVIVPIEENRFGNVRSGIGILGNSQAGQVDRNTAIDPTRKGVDYSSAEYVKMWFGGNGSAGISLEEIIKDSNRTSGRFLESQDAFPRILYQGHQQNYNPSPSHQDWSNIVHCRGHLGRNGSYPGVIEVYNRTPMGGYYLDPKPDYPTNVT